MIGLTKDSSECYIPKVVADGGDLQSFTNQEFIDLVIAMDLKKIDGSAMTSAEKTAMANSYLSNWGLL